MKERRSARPRISGPMSRENPNIPWSPRNAERAAARGARSTACPAWPEKKQRGAAWGRELWRKSGACVTRARAWRLERGDPLSTSSGERAMTTVSGSDKYARVAELADRIEAEMKRIGFWSAVPPTPEQMKFKMAYAIDTMVYDQWLQFVLLPRVRDIVLKRGAFPPSSSVG